jgi:hypothetical protein
LGQSIPKPSPRPERNKSAFFAKPPAKNDRILSEARLSARLELGRKIESQPSSNSVLALKTRIFRPRRASRLNASRVRESPTARTFGAERSRPAMTTPDKKRRFKRRDNNLYPITYFIDLALIIFFSFIIFIDISYYFLFYVLN